MFLPKGLVLIAKLPKRQITEEARLVAPSGYLHIDIGQRSFLVVLMTHDIRKASVSHQHTDTHKNLSNIQLKLLVVFFRLTEATKQVELSFFLGAIILPDFESSNYDFAVNPVVEGKYKVTMIVGTGVSWL